MRCKICEKPARLVFSLTDAGPVGPLRIFLCSACGLLFVGDLLTDAELSRAYASLDTAGYYDEIHEPTAEKAQRAVAHLLPVLGEDGAVLDVGCGAGHFMKALASARPELRIVGHELPGEAAEASRSLGFEVFTEKLGDIQESFSAIVLLDVAEHLPRPLEVFSDCFALLRPGGYLYLHTPRRCMWDTLALRMMPLAGADRVASAWFRTRVSVYHLQLWTDEALKVALANSGFRVVRKRAITELSWPLEKYLDVFLERRYRLHPAILRTIRILADQVLIRGGTLRNKAIFLATKPPLKRKVSV